MPCKASVNTSDPVKKAFNNKCACKYNYRKTEYLEDTSKSKTNTKKFKSSDFFAMSKKQKPKQKNKQK